MCTVENLDSSATIHDVKKEIHAKIKKFYPSRQSLRMSARGKSLKDEEMISSFDTGDYTFYLKDLGPQVGWSTVFYTEYNGPLWLYLLFYLRPSFIYGQEYAGTSSPYQVVHIAAACHTFHFAKRLLETMFVHRFSHGTMPIANIFKNSIYYWSFAAWMAYFVNHPKYTPPMYGDAQVYGFLALFIISELGNLSIHVALKNLRPAGSKERKIPRSTSNPFTFLFEFVSCPNYTYETIAWVAFACMTQTLVGLLFAIVGFVQMAIWALAKHRNYRKEFSNYPRSRKAIIPFLL